MKAIGSWSVVSFIRFVVQLVWAVTLVSLFVQILWLGVTLFFSEMIHWPAPVFLTPQDVNLIFEELLEEQGIAVYTTAVISANYMLFEKGGLSVLLVTALQIGLTSYLLYALTVLKRPLNALTLDRVFEPENAVQLRIVALLALSAAPLKFFYQWFSTQQFRRLVETDIVQIAMPTFNFTLLLAGMVLYIFAEIMKRAATLYEEQKLTV
ncbi:MAG: DUF2975 domain-containing protein [Balneolaceae bacterium]|nr:MAG: DUF2975 domain-containing protein [Balneolaceae bacterium]